MNHCVCLYLTTQSSLECGGPEAQALGIFNLTPLSFADGVRACRSPRIDSRLRFAGKQSGAGAPHRRGTRGLDPSSPPQRAAEIKSGVPERLPSASGCATSRRTPQIAPAVLRATCRDQIAHWATLICAKLQAWASSPCPGGNEDAGHRNMAGDGHATDAGKKDRNPEGTAERSPWVPLAARCSR